MKEEKKTRQERRRRKSRSKEKLMSLTSTVTVKTGACDGPSTVNVLYTNPGRSSLRVLIGFFGCGGPVLRLFDAGSE